MKYMLPAVGNIFRVTLCIAFLAPQASAESSCFGTIRNGYLKDGEQLPKNGDNFEVYSSVGFHLDRTYVHSKVKMVIVESYLALKQSQPDVFYTYGETGNKDGGVFEPHKTHQNGLSVDFMVPVRNTDGKPASLTCSVLNKWCYGIEFEKSGKYKKLKIDFDAIVEHLRELEKAAKKNQIAIHRVIFDLDLLKLLKDSTSWKKAPLNLSFSQKKPWVRHDEHYHVDFEVPCRPAK